MAKTKKSPRKKASARPVQRRWPGLLLKCALVLLVLIAGFVAYQDARVTSKFEGKRWALPAKVYARPLELYTGKTLAATDLNYELELLGYRRVAVISGPGTYSQSGDLLQLHTRGFKFWHERVPGQRLAIQLSRGVVSRLSGSDGRAMDLMTLEPSVIGGIYPNHNEDRSLIQLEQVPQFLLDTLVTVEDRDFYNHHGVSPKAIARAFWVNLRSGSVRQGGSTLTQQLVKNFYLTNERTLTRKLTEAVMALLLDFHYDKDEILEAYLNEVYLGQAGDRAVHGFGLASEYYFGRPINELKLHQAATLVAMVKGPSYYNPRRHPQRLLARRNLVLDLLVDNGIVESAPADWAKRQALDVVDKPVYSNAVYPAYMDLVKRQLRRDYAAEDLTSEGLRIFTSLDPLVQRAAETSVSNTIASLQRSHGENVKALQGAVVVTSTDTAEVLALVGGRDSKYAGFNRALDAVRPVGSLLKPAVYLAALSDSDSYQLSTLISDDELSVPGAKGEPWEPKNYDHESHGIVPLHQALAMSYNQAAARLGMDVGLEQVVETISELGVERRLPAYPSVILGAGGLSPIDVAGMYQTIAAGGFDAPLRAIREVTSAEGEALNRYPLDLEQRFDPGVMHLLYYALQETMREGTGRSVYRSLPENLNIAGKTGTTDDLRDSWFAGFTGDRLAVAWLGNDDNSPTRLTGSSGALKVWSNLMGQINPQPFTGTVPANVNYVWVDEASGRLSGALCEGARYLPFIAGTEPTQKSACVAKASRLGTWIKSWFE